MNSCAFEIEQLSSFFWAKKAFISKLLMIHVDYAIVKAEQFCCSYTFPSQEVLFVTLLNEDEHFLNCNKFVSSFCLPKHK